MLTVLSILGVLAVLFVAAAVATREGPILVDAPGDVADLGLPEGPLQPEDLQAVRFGLAVRGYRMAEVDAVLDRVARELADRDRQLAAAAGSAGGTAGPTPGSKADPASVTVPVVVTKAVVPVEPPLDSPPPASEPAEAEAQEAVEAAAAVEETATSALSDGDVAQPAEEPADDGTERGADDETAPAADTDTSGVVRAPDEAGASERASDAEASNGGEPTAPSDGLPPPEPPPVDVAVVRTEIAPLPPEADPEAPTSAPT